MDLGLSDKKGIVCAASKGLGCAVAFALAREGVDLIINARSRDPLKAAAEQIRAETGVGVIPVAADITTEEGRDAVLAACSNPDILINNAGGPPPGDFRNVKREDWIRAIDANMLTPVFLIRAVIDGMIERGFGRIINITTMGVKSPGSYPQLGISIGVRSGLTGFVGVLSRQVARHDVTINEVSCDRILRSITGLKATPLARPSVTIAALRRRNRRWPKISLVVAHSRGWPINASVIFVLDKKRPRTTLVKTTKRKIPCQFKSEPLWKCRGYLFFGSSGLMAAREAKS